MERSDALREAAKVVEVLESAGVLVEDVSVSETGDGESPLDLRLRLPDEPLELSGVERGSTPESPGERTVDEDDEESPVECPVAGCAETFDSEHGTKIHVAKRHDDVPAHRDPERLATVYERHDTFAAMREALDSGVTAQTVRRNMMKHGIHDPSEANDADAITNAGTSDPVDASGADEGATDRNRADDESAAGSDAGEGAERSDEDEGLEVADEDEGPEGTDAEAGLVEDRRDSSGDDRPAATDGGATTAPLDGGPSGIDGTGDADGPDAPEPFPADAAAALDLPGGVTADELVAVVADARTLFDVQRAMDLGRPATKSMLADLDMLEFVHGRVADGDERCETPVAEVRRRLREQVE
ncbi:hypothetical protein BRC81_08900 [Halobacteriales archaeon QS_1_68_20]|nr:MAG: hypothetical protein BRC81_08900 [Halobacteriales archaeon QS_1_68_20]